jgi:hypothetical protein
MGMLRGQSHPMAKLTDIQVLNIRELWDMGHRNVKVIANNFNITYSNVIKIVKRKTWTHLL